MSICFLMFRRRPTFPGSCPPSIIGAKAGALSKYNCVVFVAEDWGLREQNPNQEETQSVSTIMRRSAIILKNSFCYLTIFGRRYATFIISQK